MSTGVEIEQDVLNPDHPKNVKEVQKLSFLTEDLKNKYTLQMDNCDRGTWKIMFTSVDLSKTTTEELEGCPGVRDLRNEINGYFLA